ncbi:MAG: hypothetical protein II237_03405 [Clostridia bacterium]|nr:hypothetical protein [Clostridia bacterium]
MKKLQNDAFSGISEYLENCYDDGFIGAMFDIHGQGIPLFFPIDQEAVVRAVQLDSKISKGLYNHLGENFELLKRHITAQVSRGISNGSTFAQVAQQLSFRMIGTYENPGGALAYAMRIARTEGHRIQVQGAMDACYKSKDVGADIVKQWDSTLDKRTRKSHKKVDGEIRELDETFSNGLMFPGDPDGGAEEVIHCRCALLERARWALDDEELETLKKRAEYFGLDKTDNFDDFKKKYLKAVAPPKKEYLTKKKLEQKIAEGNTELEALKQEFADELEYNSYDEFFKDYKDLDDALNQAMLFGTPDEVTKLHQQIKNAKVIQSKIDDLQKQLDDWDDLLDKKLVKSELKKLKKEQLLLKDQLDNANIKTYSNIWKDDVTTLDYASKQGSIQAKKAYFQQKLSYATDPADIKKWQDLLDDLDDFEKSGAEYFKIKSQYDKVSSNLTKLQKSGTLKSAKIDDAFSQDRKDAAYWFTDQNGSVKAADGVLRDKAGEVWRSASTLEKDSIYEYTGSYHKYNEPLRGIEYGTNKFLGVGNVDLDQIGVSYYGFKPGQIHKEIDAITSSIDKSSYDFDI